MFVLSDKIFAALPVEDKSWKIIFWSFKYLINPDISDVLPVPAKPLRMKILF